MKSQEKIVVFPPGYVAGMEATPYIPPANLQIFDAHCATNGQLLCSLDAADFDQAALRIVQVFGNDTNVEKPIGNVRLTVHPEDTGLSSPNYFLNGWFILLEERGLAAN